MRIAIVNDVVLIREGLKRLVLEGGVHHVLWEAEDGAEAVRKCAMDTPDLILMDLLMPVMDGVQATKLIMKHSPCAIVIVTASVSANMSMVFDAMGFGALDAVQTPKFGQSCENSRALQKKIEVVEAYLGTSHAKGIHQHSYWVGSHMQAPPLLLIGASTGGPAALAVILSKIPEGTEYAVAVIQHVDEKFTGGLAKWLGKHTPLSVEIAKEGAPLKPGHVVLAGQDKHLVITPHLTLHYQDNPTNILYCPSVDIFFQSAADYWPTKSVAVLLTGMGSDGALGMKRLYDKGWHTVVQNQATCVVFGMSKSAIELGAVKEVLSLEEIALKCGCSQGFK